MLPQPLQHFESIHARHFEVQEQQIGCWKLFSICVGALALEIGDYLMAIFQREDELHGSKGFEGARNEQPIIG